jgi:hypothetical protein
MRSGLRPVAVEREPHTGAASVDVIAETNKQIETCALGTYCKIRMRLTTV